MHLFPWRISPQKTKTKKKNKKNFRKKVGIIAMLLLRHVMPQAFYTNMGKMLSGPDHPKNFKCYFYLQSTVLALVEKR